jgi:hypothetical protein
MSGVLVFLAGVALPASALAVELLWRLCSEVFFNPVPGAFHAAMVALVPAANLWALLALRKGSLSRPLALARANGAALGVSVFYALLFLPLMPLGVVGLLFMGMGILLLSPALSLLSAWVLRRHLARRGAAGPRGGWVGLVCAIGTLALLEMPSTLTRAGQQMAASEDTDTRARGLAMLRFFGDRDLLLRLCYGRPARATDLGGFLFSLGRPVPMEKAREIFYRVEGVPHNSLPPPRDAGQGWLDREEAIDPGQGGTAVAGAVPGLSLVTSEIRAVAEPASALSYQEWTLEFENRGPVQAEARAQIELPPGGVVSRLTLWVGGEEREAAFAARGRVREAYGRVVQDKRDPVLVTTQGEGRVLMQCFPVPARGGRMKVRLGITSPLAFSSAGEAHFHLPRMAERNFAVTGEGGLLPAPGGRALHSIRVEADRPFPPPGDGWEARQEEGRHILTGRRSDAWLSEGRSFAVEGIGGIRTAWAMAPARVGGFRVEQRVVAAPRRPPGDLILVVDGSKGLASRRDDIAEAVRRAGERATVVAAVDGGILEAEGGAQEIAHWLERLPFRGGQDNVPALARALELASARKGTLLWIHAAQPVVLSGSEALRSALTGGRPGVRIQALQAANGPNRLIEGVEGTAAVEVLRLSGSFREELAALLSPLSGARLVLERRRAAAGPAPGGAVRASDHLVRLLVRDEIESLLREGGPSSREQAIALGADFRLVTRATGAVVLETAEQYREAGLEPADPATVPAVPEPEALLLILAAVLALGWGPLRAVLRKARERRPGRAFAAAGPHGREA